MPRLPHVSQRAGPSYCCHMLGSYSDSSRPVWSASSKRPASFVIQLHVTTSRCLGVSAEATEERRHFFLLSQPGLPSEALRSSVSLISMHAGQYGGTRCRNPSFGLLSVFEL